MKYKDESHKYKLPYGQSPKEKYTDTGRFYEQIVTTEYGYVRVYAQDRLHVFQTTTPHTQLSIVGQDSMVHYRTWRKFYSPRYTVTLANRFAEDVFNQLKNK